MNTTTLKKLFCTALCSLALTACVDRYFEDPTLELYTRNFIKEFGLIGENQDWNMAQSATVKLNLGTQKPGLVKVYTETAGTYYLVARLKGVTGQFDVPIQIPEGTKDVLVDVDGKSFYGQIGQLIDCTSDGVKSRDIFGGGTKTAGGYTVSVSYATTGNLYNQDRSADGLTKPIRGVTNLIQYGEDYASSQYNAQYPPSVTTGILTSWNSDVLEMKSYPQSRYSYFNAQQILPIVANGDPSDPEVSYYSLNEQTIFTHSPQGILPEKGEKNQLRPSHIDENGITPDAVVGMGNYGKITVFPYYYNATYIHTFGVYLINNGKPVRDNNNEIIKYPVFNDKQPGDIQIAPKLVGISRIECDHIDLEVGQTKNIYDYVRVYDQNDQVVSNYPTGYSSKLGFHYYGTKFFSIDRKGNITGLYAGSNTGQWDPRLEVAAEGEKAETTVTVTGSGSTTPTANTTIEFDYDYTLPAGAEFVADGDHGKLTIPVGYDGILPVKCISSEEETLESIFSGIVLDRQYGGSLFEIYEDNTNNIVKIRGNSEGSEWAHVEYKKDGATISDLAIEVFVYTPTVHKHTYSEPYNFDSSNASSSPISLSNWQTNYFEETTLTGKQEKSVLWSGTQVVENWAGNVEIDKSNFSDVTTDDYLRLYFTLQSSPDKYNCIKLSKNVGGWPVVSGLESPYTSSETPGQLNFDINNAPEYVDIKFTSDLINDVTSEGLVIFGYYFTLTKVAIVSEAASGTKVNVWTASGKSDAAGALVTHYNSRNPGSKPCSCGSTVDFSGVTPEVTISDDADYDHIKYTVTWSKDADASGAPKRAKAPKSKSSKASAAKQKQAAPKAPSRDKDPIFSVNTSSKNSSANLGWFGSRAGSDDVPAMLKFPNTSGWREVNKIWDRTRPEEDEAATFITDDPVLARSRGYDIVITDKNGDPYTGDIGFYIDVYQNPYRNYTDDNGNGNYYDHWGLGWTDYNATNVVNDRVSGLEYLYTLYSQPSLNVETYNGKDYEMTYAVSFPHPKSERTFYAFEDWKITHPATGDKDTDGIELSGVGYADSDNSSDRDYNDLIYLLQLYEGAKIKPSSDLNKNVDEEGYSWFWALEDLGSTYDFDFNDIVIKINAITETISYTGEPNEGEETPEPETIYRVTLTPLAAGGTLPTYVHFSLERNGVKTIYVLAPGEYDLRSDAAAGANVPSTFTSSDNEYHAWFGVRKTTQMINTGVGTLRVPVTNAMKCVLLLDTGDFNLENQTMDYYKSSLAKSYLSVSVDDPNRTDSFGAQVIDGNYEIPMPQNGVASQSFLIFCGQDDKDHPNTVTWAWPTERTHIIDAYPDFKNWVNNPDNATYKTWMDRPKSESLIYHSR